MTYCVHNRKAGALPPSSALTRFDAEKIVEAIPAWVGWDDWEQGGLKTIRLDGRFTLRELEALILVLARTRPLALRTSSDRT